MNEASSKIHVVDSRVGAVVFLYYFCYGLILDDKEEVQKHL